MSQAPIDVRVQSAARCVGLTIAAIVGATFAVACDESRNPPSSGPAAPCSAPVCSASCACDQSTACDPDCDGCDPECGQCRAAACAIDGSVPTADGGADADAASPASCAAQLPPGQTMSAACCPDHGRDACGAVLFCAALDGRQQPSCYPERSRLDQTECPADYACASGSCNTERQRCRSAIGNVCSMEIGCAPSPTGARAVCDQRRSPMTCQPIGDGARGAVCGQSSDCISGRCDGMRCTAGAGEPCANATECAIGRSCAPCELCADGDFSDRCVATCSGLDCSRFDLQSCLPEDTITAVDCPGERPSELRCRLEGWRADFTAIQVRLRWSERGGDAYEVTCGPDPSFTNASYVRVSDWATIQDFTIDPATRGSTYHCRVRFLTRTNHNRIDWLFGPESTCSVTFTP